MTADRPLPQPTAARPNLARGRIAAALAAIAVTVIATATGGAHATSSVASAAPTADPPAALTAGDRRLSIVDQPLPGAGIERRFVEGGAVLYRSRIQPTDDALVVEVLDGHPSQRGRFRVAAGQLAVEAADGRPLWREPLAEPLCLPELLGEFVRAHWRQLAPGSAPLRCGTPILKAGKVAPVQFTRLADLPDGRRVVEFGPGSLGMRLFLVPTRLTFSADGTRLLSHDGQFEAPRRVDGRAAYLRGTAVWPQGRTIADWPAARFAPAAAASTGSARPAVASASTGS